MGDQGTIKNLLNHDFENARIGFLRERIPEAQRHWGKGRRKETEVSKWPNKLLRGHELEERSKDQGNQRARSLGVDRELT